MIFRFLLTLTVIVMVCAHTLTGLPSPNSHQNHFEDSESSMNVQSDDQHDLVGKRDRNAKAHPDPLWLSPKARINRLYGKPLWISRFG